MSSLSHRGNGNSSPERPVLYAPRAFTAPLVATTALPAQSARRSAAGGVFSRQSLMILTLGIMMGYLLLPVLLVQHLGFDDLPLQTTAKPSNSIKMYGVNAIGTKNNKNAGGITMTTDVPSRSLADEKKSSPDTHVDVNTETIQKEEQTPPDIPDVESAADEEENHAAGADEKTSDEAEESSAKEMGDAMAAVKKVPVAVVSSSDADQQKTVVVPGAAVAGSIAPLMESLNAAEKRIVEDRDILSRQSVPTASTPYSMKTAVLPDHHRKKILVTGGSGFVGSHLVDKLMMEGHEVIVVDNFFTGQKKNIAHWLHHPNFSLVVHDVTEPIQLEVDQIYHLACPASPPHYQYNPVKTIKTSTMGTLNMLGLAKRVRARILLTSTSEIYGDPQVHPQHESYWGNVNTIGPRSCYDEGKRVAETMMYSYRNQNQVDVRVARIFNTFGPRMHPNDGRVVSNFIIQSLQQKNMTIYGEGKQTRSFQYVSDLVDGLHALMNGNYDMPVNLGNPDEYTVKDFAEYIKKMTESKSEIVFLPKSQDDPSQRRPDISTAKREIGWEPKITVEQGLKNTIAYFSRVLAEAGEIIPTGPGAAKPEA